MRYYKNYKLGIGFGGVGRNAYEVSKNWRLGTHVFTTSTNLIFRICYLRTKKRTYYWQISIQVKKQYDCCSQ